MPLTLSFDPTHPFAAAARQKDTATFLLVDKDTKEPVAVVTQLEGGTRDDTYMFGDNVAALMNGKSPLHRHGQAGRTAQWVRNEETPPNELRVHYHFRAADGFHSAGVSSGNPAVKLMVIGTHLPMFEKLLFNNDDARKTLLDQMSLEERRGVARTHDSKPLTPKNTPNF